MQISSDKCAQGHTHIPAIETHNFFHEHFGFHGSEDRGIIILLIVTVTMTLRVHIYEGSVSLLWDGAFIQAICGLWLVAEVRTEPCPFRSGGPRQQ